MAVIGPNKISIANTELSHFDCFKRARLSLTKEIKIQKDPLLQKTNKGLPYPWEYLSSVTESTRHSILVAKC